MKGEKIFAVFGVFALPFVSEPGCLGLLDFADWPSACADSANFGPAFLVASPTAWKDYYKMTNAWWPEIKSVKIHGKPS